MVEYALGSGLRQHSDVIGWTYLVQFLQQCGICGHITEPDTCQTELGNRTHDDQIVELRQARHEAFLRKRLIGFVDYHHATVADGTQHGLDIGGIVERTGRIIRIGQIRNRRTMQLNGSQQRRQIEREIAIERHPHVLQPCKARRDLIHDKTGLRCQHLGTGLGTGNRDDGNKLVRAITQHDIKASRHTEVATNLFFELRTGRHGITIERDLCQTLP